MNWAVKMCDSSHHNVHPRRHITEAQQGALQQQPAAEPLLDLFMSGLASRRLNVANGNGNGNRNQIDNRDIPRRLQRGEQHNRLRQTIQDALEVALGAAEDDADADADAGDEEMGTSGEATQ